MQQGQKLLPKVKMRSGLRDRRVGALKVHLKASEPKPEPRQAGGSRQRAHWAAGVAPTQREARQFPATKYSRSSYPADASWAKDSFAQS